MTNAAVHCCQATVAYWSWSFGSTAVQVERSHCSYWSPNWVGPLAVAPAGSYCWPCDKLGRRQHGATEYCEHVIEEALYKYLKIKIMAPELKYVELTYVILMIL
jgi:hypothetical protein